MFNDVENAVKRAVSGEIDSTSLQQAAQQHVQAADPQTVKNNMQTAADKASESGQQDLAQQIRSMLEQHHGDPQALKQDLISLVKNNPQILRHFEQDFAQKILSRI